MTRIKIYRRGSNQLWLLMEGNKLFSYILLMGMLGASLHLVSSQNTFLWNLIFVDVNTIPHGLRYVITACPIKFAHGFTGLSPGALLLTWDNVDTSMDK